MIMPKYICISAYMQLMNWLLISRLDSSSGSLKLKAGMDYMKLPHEQYDLNPVD